MILEKQPLSLAEAKDILSSLENNKELQVYLKKFSKIPMEKAKKLKEEIKALNNPKIKDENIIKIIDFLPKDPEEVNKIFIEASLSEGEINAIIEIVKKY